MTNAFSPNTFIPTYSDERARFCSSYRRATSEQTRTDAIRHSPLVSLAVKFAVDKPSEKPSNGLGNTSSSRTVFGGTTFGGNISDGALFGGTATPAPASQQPQSATGPAAKPFPTQTFSFGQSNSQPAPFSRYGVDNASLFGSSAPPVIFTGGPFPFGQSADNQHKRQASSQSGGAPSGGEPKVMKLEEQSSPTNGRLANDGTPGKSVLSSWSATSTKSTFSFPSAQTQTNGSATTKPTTSIFEFNTAAHKSSSSSTFSFGCQPFGTSTYRESSDQQSLFGMPTKYSLPVKPMSRNLTLPQYGLLGFDLDNCDNSGNPEPIMLNTNSPSSVFLCGSQGSGKSYTLSCMLETHLLYDPSVGLQRETIPGYVFHRDTNTSGSLAEAASLCSRGIKVRLLVSWSNYRQMKDLYENFATKVKGKIEVRPLLFGDTELTVNNIRNLMAFRDGSHDTPLYLEVIQNILRRLGRKSERFSVAQFLRDLDAANLIPSQLQMLDQRLNILKTFSAATAPAIVSQDQKGLAGQELVNERKKQGLGFKGECITVEKGTLTIADLSDPFVDASTACVLFEICLGIILKRHKEAVTANKISPGLIITLDEAHKFLDKGVPSADIFTSSLLTTIREQRHNATRVIIATQEPTISEKLLDLCSISIVHRFNSPA